MKTYIKSDSWKIIEEEFNPDNQRSSESIFSLGNGQMGQRANFEEKYSGSSLQGSYMAGVYYPDKTRVGWWKNGYPEYFAKVINSPSWINIHIRINGEELDLKKCKTEDFIRTLDMQKGLLTRSFNATLNNGVKIKAEASRFLSMNDPECGLIKYTITPLNFTGKIVVDPFIDGDVENEDSNYGEKFWNIEETKSDKDKSSLIAQTKKLDFKIAYCSTWTINGTADVKAYNTSVKAGSIIEVPAVEGKTIVFEKYTGIASSLNHNSNSLLHIAEKKATNAKSKGFDQMEKEHINRWAEIWKQSDIKIEGDIKAQQGIRFNIFHINQTYTGEDERFNIGPKGFTGEKYGGSTYWDTEAYCIPFFLATAPPHVTKNLLIYRYKHLQKAIENGAKLGFTNGAALYPMVTMNGEECHNEWEITFEEVHRNSAIAFAIYNYIRHTGDEQYLDKYGLEVLIAISRFWAQRVNWSNKKKKYVMLGVTGPNEYENNINNNWYTNQMAVWCLNYTIESLEKVKKSNSNRYNEIVEKTSFNFKEEVSLWNEIANNIHLPYNKELNIFMQQDGYMNKIQQTSDELPQEVRPINQHWSWDRILRSCFIKQADTLQGIYVLEDKFDTETIRRHFDFYEPRTLHESSLSPCVHSILAARTAKIEKAYELYLRTSRLDIDDYNNEVHEGLHITSMAGTWMSIVEGFGGKRVKEGNLHFNPVIPKKWSEFSFKITFKGDDMQIKVDKDKISITSYSKKEFNIYVYDEKITVKPQVTVSLKLKPNYYA
ncbi:family 65 glycosyl hydrolase domain-containing protein [Marinilabiliaceae bacterium ANBcel2]|nr:family 65 glycosyl hydrolase domain-containing protein [Marinilabiliaceae bacterium ANBcel2]